jgi:lambda repressor-like predicted transcriptional regulator
MYINIFDKEKLKNSYLKGVSIKHLSLQSGLKVASIEQVLREQGIPIVSNALPIERKKRYRGGKK